MVSQSGGYRAGKSRQAYCSYGIRETLISSRALAREVPGVRKCGKLPIQENLGIT